MTSSLTSLLQTLRIVPITHTKLPSTVSTATTDKLELATVTPEASLLPIISLDEVSEHDSYDDCWIVIYDRVYDVTNFLRSHPGGEDVIMDHAGRDATLAFHGTGHSSDAVKQMRSFLIGELPAEERIFRTTNGRVIRLDLPE